MLLFVPKMARELCEEHELDNDVGVREGAGLPPEAPLCWGLSDNVECTIPHSASEQAWTEAQGLLFT